MAAATSKVWRKAPFSPPHLRTQQEALLAAWQNKYFLLVKSITLVLPLRRANEDSLCTDPPNPSLRKNRRRGPLVRFFQRRERVCTQTKMKTTLWVCIGQSVRLRVRLRRCYVELHNGNVFEEKIVIGQLHDDVILLQLPESLRLLFSSTN